MKASTNGLQVSRRAHVGVTSAETTQSVAVLPLDIASRMAGGSAGG